MAGLGDSSPLKGGINNTGGGPASGSGGDPQPDSADVTGFGGIATQFGLSSNYKAHAASADYGGKGYGMAGYLGQQTGNQAANLQHNQTYNGSFAGPNTNLGDQRTAADYGQAAGHVGNLDSFYGYGQAEQLGNLQRQAGLDAAIRAQSAMAKSGSPSQGGLAAYNAANQGSAMMSANTNQAAQNAIGLKQQYDQMLQNQQLQNRQMDLGLLGQSQNNAQFNANYNLRQGEMNQQQYMGLLGLQQQYAAQDQQGQEAYANLASNNYNQAQGINAGVATQQAAGGNQLFGATVTAMSGGMSAGAGGMGGGGAAGGGGGGVPEGVESDIRAKTNIQPAGAPSMMQGANVSSMGMPSASQYRPSAMRPNLGGMNPGGQIAVSEGTKVNSMPGNAFAGTATPAQQAPAMPYLGQSAAPLPASFASNVTSDIRAKSYVRSAGAVDQNRGGTAGPNLGTKEHPVYDISQGVVDRVPFRTIEQTRAGVTGQPIAPAAPAAPSMQDVYRMYPQAQGQPVVGQSGMPSIYDNMAPQQEPLMMSNMDYANQLRGIGNQDAVMSDEDVKTGVRYADQDTYGKAKHNDYYRNDKVKSNAHWVSNDPTTREAFRMRNEEFGYEPVMSDEHVKTAVHAAGHAKGYEAGYRAAIAQGNNPGRSNAYDAALAMGYKPSSPAGMAMLGSGNGTNAQRNAAIDAELARIAGTASASEMTSQRKAAANAAMARMAGTSTPQLQQDVINGRAVPPMTASPDTWDRLQNISSGNIRQSDVNDELESMDGELPAPRAAAPAAYPVEPISSLHQAPYADYYEPADRGMSPMYKSRNEQDMGPLASSVMSDERVKASIQKDKRFPTGGPHVYEGTTSVDARPSYTVKYDVDKSFGPGRDLMSDANVKTVDATPVYKEQYPDVVAKWKNENYDRAPAKDPKKFPMPVRPLGEVMSDEKAKMVRPGGETDADRFLESLQPFTFKYKSPDMEPTDSPTGGRYLGVMAQNVQKGPTGDTIVKQTPRGLALEGGALLSALSGGEGRLAERVSALEAQLAKSKKGK